MKQKERCVEERVCAYPYCSGTDCHVIGLNKNDYPVSINIAIKARNLYYEKGGNENYILEPNEKKELKLLRQRNLADGYSVNVSWIWCDGSFLTKPDSGFIYQLPFPKGKAYLIGQGYNGKATHQGSYKYSIDFELKTGDTVSAARGGVVIRAVDKNDRGCFEVECEKYSNFIEIIHSDGTLAIYGHLQKNGVLVSIGDTVEVGKKIGLSGATGRVNGPHLHFMVGAPVSPFEFMTIPTVFRTKLGFQKELAEGKVYQ